jgi:hypothetical protein
VAARLPPWGITATNGAAFTNTLRAVPDSTVLRCFPRQLCKVLFPAETDGLFLPVFGVVVCAAFRAFFARSRCTQVLHLCSN